jgi:hypothetical protein
MLRRADEDEADRQHHGAQREHRTSAMRPDGAARSRRNQTRNQERDRKAAHDMVIGPAGIADDRRGEHRQQVEGRAPGQDLQRAEHRYDQPLAAAIHRPLGAFCCHGRSPPDGA